MTLAEPAIPSGIPDADAVIRVRDLQKRYGDVQAVAGIDFEVGRGEVFGLLGPNGAGKSTTIEILEAVAAAPDTWPACLPALGVDQLGKRPPPAGPIRGAERRHVARVAEGQHVLTVHAVRQAE